MCLPYFPAPSCCCCCFPLKPLNSSRFCFAHVSSIAIVPWMLGGCVIRKHTSVKGLVVHSGYSCFLLPNLTCSLSRVHRWDEVRHQAVSLLAMFLTEEGGVPPPVDLQNFVAFQDGFDKLFKAVGEASGVFVLMPCGVLFSPRIFWHQRPLCPSQTIGDGYTTVVRVGGFVWPIWAVVPEANPIL